MPSTGLLVHKHFKQVKTSALKEFKLWKETSTNNEVTVQLAIHFEQLSVGLEQASGLKLKCLLRRDREFKGEKLRL